ncbi:hypothetical protein WJX74_002335 [Apatococcus lobatus]|uniref:Rieske domain-containing protein n=1 Tax=Apatococcus lobatus TaxID=904363 RepID=A0AAW1S110_9CHLO
MQLQFCALRQCSCSSAQSRAQRLCWRGRGGAGLAQLSRSTAPVYPRRQCRSRPAVRAQRDEAAGGETTIKLGRRTSDAAPREDGFVAAIAPEELPKGARKEVNVGGEQVLLFWYRNDIVAIEPRSPAEGAYSEGFISAKLTPDNCIECPSTSSLFDLTTGEIKAWYPKNPVLRLLTPQDTARNMIVYSVKLESEAILVNVGSSSADPSFGSTRGGAGTSSAGNNIYALQPQTYVQGNAVGDTGTPSSGAPDKLDNFTVGVAGLGFGITAITGTTISLVNKSYGGLAFFWAVLLFLRSVVGQRFEQLFKMGQVSVLELQLLLDDVHGFCLDLGMVATLMRTKHHK